MMDFRLKTVCFTGHRKVPNNQIEIVTHILKETLISLIKRDYCYFGTGGAIGFDTVAAQTVLRLKESYPHIKLILVLPCVSQADYWNKGDKIAYEFIKERADKVVYTSMQYTKDSIFKRNRHLVENSSVCICYLTEREGGTAYTVDYAKKKGLIIINIAKKQVLKSTC